MKRFAILLLACCFSFLLFAQESPQPADVILQNATAKAVKENKKVLVIFHASWCGWCRKMDTALNDVAVKDFFQRNFVIEHLTIHETAGKKHLENPGAEELNKKWGGGEQGLPYWVILDSRGDVLADSRDVSGDNVGCPASKAEVDHFIAVLKKTTSINDTEVAAVEQRFRRNEQ